MTFGPLGVPSTPALEVVASHLENGALEAISPAVRVTTLWKKPRDGQASRVPETPSRIFFAGMREVLHTRRPA
jgi:hypothetical protein